MLAVFGLLGMALLGMALMPVETGGEDDSSSDETDRSVDLPSGEKSDSIFDDHAYPLNGSWDDCYPSGYLLSAASNSNVVSPSGSSRVLGGAGNDALLGTDGSDLIIGFAGEDLLQGGDGDDTLNGFSGESFAFSDYIRGGSGDDLLIGGALDRLVGGTGKDCFFISTEAIIDGEVVIEDFNSSEDEIVIAYQSGDTTPEIEFEETDIGTTIFIGDYSILTLVGVRNFDIDIISFAEIESMTCQ